MLDFVSPGAILIALISLSVLLLWEHPALKKYLFFQSVPGILMAVAAGVLSNKILQHFYPDLALSNGHLVMIPVMQDAADFISQLHAPDFSAITQPRIYLTALTLAVVASLETLLAVEAVDKLDIYKRKTPANRELIAQGIGNISSGLIGGLPLTQVIVRSSFNIQSGAKTRAAGFTSGLLLLLTVIFIPDFLHQIPLASLAAILLVVAYKLARLEVLETMYRAGMYHFIPFCATIAGLVFTDMLTGIIIGLTTALFSI